MGLSPKSTGKLIHTIVLAIGPVPFVGPRQKAYMNRFSTFLGQHLSLSNEAHEILRKNSDH